MKHQFTSNKLTLTATNSHQPKPIRRTFNYLVEDYDDEKVTQVINALTTLTDDHVTATQVTTVTALTAGDGE